MEKNYNQQALEFLKKHVLNLSIKQAVPQKSPLWLEKKSEEYGLNYYCSLVNKDGKHYSFDFWGSIHDKHTGKHPRAYDVLACLDTYADGQSFEDFCNDFGYDTDSIQAEKTYQAVIKQIDGLKKVLTPEALEELNEIN
jgi:hypothetical protein